jgi:hypothetical protein
MTPVRIGFVYVSVVSMLNLVKLQWPGGILTILSRSGMQLSMFKLDVLQGAACFLSFKTTFYLALCFPFALALALLGVLGLSTLMTREHRGFASVRCSSAATCRSCPRPTRTWPGAACSSSFAPTLATLPASACTPLRRLCASAPSGRACFPPR